VRICEGAAQKMNGCERATRCHKQDGIGGRAPTAQPALQPAAHRAAPPVLQLRYEMKCTISPTYLPLLFCCCDRIRTPKLRWGADTQKSAESGGGSTLPAALLDRQRVQGVCFCGSCEHCGKKNRTRKNGWTSRFRPAHFDCVAFFCLSCSAIMAAFVMNDGSWPSW